ncbi:MFS transporter [Streptomyces sp. MS1.AVA.1]|uniref:MFS transporter n=1 Tax=Streptomyces machairae TaxID=3134109 RepID=A0ABU8UFL2_9ACTN
MTTDASGSRPLRVSSHDPHRTAHDRHHRLDTAGGPGHGPVPGRAEHVDRERRAAQIRTGLDLSAAGQTWTVNAYVLVFGALLLPGGRAGDVYGLRRVFLLGIGLFALSSLGAALAPTTSVLIACRAVQGIGAALLAPTALALVLTLYPDSRRRGTALGVWARSPVPAERRACC